MRHSFVYDSAAHASRCRDCDLTINDIDGAMHPALIAGFTDHDDCPAPYRRHRLVTLGEGSRCLTCGQSWTDEQRREYPPEMAPPWATEPCSTLSPEAVA